MTCYVVRAAVKNSGNQMCLNSKINCLLCISVQPRGLIVQSVVNRAVKKKAVKVCWQIPCREVKLSDSYESNNSQLTSSKTTGSVFRSKFHLG